MQSKQLLLVLDLEEDVDDLGQGVQGPVQDYLVGGPHYPSILIHSLHGDRPVQDQDYVLPEDLLCVQFRLLQFLNGRLGLFFGLLFC